MNQNSELGDINSSKKIDLTVQADNNSSSNAIGVVNLEVDSNTDLPQEYFQFISQENESMRIEIQEMTS